MESDQMAFENDGTTELQPAVHSTTPVDVTATPAAPAAQPPKAVGKSATQVIPTATLGKIKAEQRERGQREAMAQLEAKFKAAGFDSIDAALGAMSNLRGGGQSQQQAGRNDSSTQPMLGQQTQGRPNKRELERLQREREQFAKRYAQEQAQRRRLQRQLEAKDAEMALRETAASKGVRDLDYALRLLQRELEGKSDDELESFDEGAFFDGLRSQRPYLFGVTEVPANTGTGIGAAPSAPKAGQVQQAQGAAGRTDARSMNREEFNKLLRARGLNISAG